MQSANDWKTTITPDCSPRTCSACIMKCLRQALPISFLYVLLQFTCRVSTEDQTSEESTLVMELSFSSDDGGSSSSHYVSKFSEEDLLNLKVQPKISSDVDMDPCKAGTFTVICTLSMVMTERFFSFVSQMPSLETLRIRVKSTSVKETSVSLGMPKLPQNARTEGGERPRPDQVRTVQ